MQTTAVTLLKGVMETFSGTACFFSKETLSGNFFPPQKLFSKTAFFNQPNTIFISHMIYVHTPDSSSDIFLKNWRDFEAGLFAELNQNTPHTYLVAP
jgi:hypothetical protein